MVDHKDETPEQRAARERQEERNQNQSQESRERASGRADETDPPLGEGNPVPPLLGDEFETLTEETQAEVAAGAAAVKRAEEAAGGGDEKPLAAYSTEPPGITTFAPGEFVGQESAASPVGTEPNPPEGVTPLTHTPIDPAPLTDLEDQGLDAKERKALYEAQHSRSPGDLRPAEEIANEIQEKKDRELEQNRRNRGVDPRTGKANRDTTATQNGEADTARAARVPLSERVSAARTQKSQK